MFQDAKLTNYVILLNNQIDGFLLISQITKVFRVNQNEQLRHRQRVTTGRYRGVPL